MEDDSGKMLEFASLSSISELSIDVTVLLRDVLAIPTWRALVHLL